MTENFIIIAIICYSYRYIIRPDQIKACTHKKEYTLKLRLIPLSICNFFTSTLSLMSFEVFKN